MTLIKAKGYEFNLTPIRDSYDRRAIQFKNSIIAALKKAGITEDDVDIDIQSNARLAGQATAKWYSEGYLMQYSHQSQPKYAENLCVVLKVIEKEVDALIRGEKPFEDFITTFTEKKDIDKTRKEAREILGVEPHCLDLDLITKKYKFLARQHHPDMNGGDAEQFKRIGNAFNALKRELQ